ncbi:MAG: ATP-binding protein [Verrucomicrobiales bacterium]|nr:ATP-binding protein [Verrucomicrobiales bacterium]
MPLFPTIGGASSTARKGTAGLSPFVWKMMHVDERRVTTKNQRLITGLIVCLVPLFSFLDFFVYPEYFTEFLVLRLSCVLATLVCFAFLHTSLGKKYYRASTVLLPLIPAFFISLMIMLSKDPATPYYAGLTLCIVAIGFVFHWTYIEAFFSTVSVAGMFFLASSPAVFLGMDIRTAAGFINNCIFISATGIVIVLGSIAHHRFRVENYMVRDRFRRQQVVLQNQKQELEKAVVELRRTENQLIQSEKMASLGQLSAGVIHEIGNPLNYSNQALFLLKKLLKNHEDGSHVREAIDDIQDSFDRMKSIVSELREFSHKSSEIRIEFSLIDSVQVAIRMLGKEISDSNVRIDLQVDPKLRIDAVKNQITQVFVNLIHNSIQAMAKADMEAKEGFVSIFGRKLNDTVELIVVDNGPGIEPEHCKQLFDPFFTTKQPGEGTGLGLSICYRIIESHCGRISVSSQVGSFTKFNISLPIVEQREDAIASTVSHSPIPKQHAIS